MKVILFIFALVVAQLAMADEISQKSLQLCEKVKTCAVAELDGQKLSEDMRTLLMSSMDGMCAVMLTEFETVKKENQDLHPQAIACLDSLSSLSCSVLMDGATDTPACVALEKAAASKK